MKCVDMRFQSDYLQLKLLQSDNMFISLFLFLQGVPDAKVGSSMNSENLLGRCQTDGPHKDLNQESAKKFVPS